MPHTLSAEDTIVAVATPPGRGGIGVVRLSGPGALAIASRLLGREDDPPEARRATFGRVRASADHGPAFDHVVCTFFPGPHSYTGEDVVELSAHGNPVVLARIVDEATQAGARLARPGEFTLRAYLHGRLDLVQAEAVADLVEAVTPAQARLAFDQLDGTLTDAIGELEQIVFELITRLEASLDYPEEDYHFATREDVGVALHAATDGISRLLAGAREGRLIREGASVVIVGRPNVGKSSVFNRLVGAGRAIVSTVPGTTRDLVTERCDIEGIPLTVVDTAGLREPTDEVEREGVRRARSADEVADLRVVVLDRSAPLEDGDEAVLAALRPGRHVVVANKSDLDPAWGVADLDGRVGAPFVEVSAASGAGFEALRGQLARSLGASDVQRDPTRISNVRHIRLLERAQAALARAREALDGGASEEFVLADLREASQAFEEVTGRRTPEDVLNAVFARFCLGK